MAHKGLRRSAIRKHNRKRGKSSIEKLVAAWLIADGIPFRTEVKAGRCHIDIVIGKNGAVELNGCYWHSCLKCFPSLSKEARLKRFRDIHRYVFLGKRGYKLLVLWEHEILSDPDATRERLKEYGMVHGTA